MSRYAKAIVALLALCGVVGQALADGTVAPAEWGQIATAAAGAAGVFLVRNKPAPKP